MADQGACIGFGVRFVFGQLTAFAWKVYKKAVFFYVSRHAYGCDLKRRNNLHVLSDTEVVYVAGGLTVIHDIVTKEQRFLQPSVGCCPRQVAVRQVSGASFQSTETGRQTDR